jgi:electron transfer flavoprotein-quinone oxidoreductase
MRVRAPTHDAALRPTHSEKPFTRPAYPIWEAGDLERFDAIVVGAGPAGSAAALTLVRKGFTTLLVERGRVPGAKGMFGGRVYAWAVQDLLQDWAKDCPVERYVVRENMAFLTQDASLGISFESPKLGQGRTASFTALRATFDAWLAKKAQDAGAMLVTGIRVDDLWREGGRVRGVSVVPNDRVAADLVVIAEGATSVLVRAAGLRADLEPREVSVGVKETIELPAETIQERFGLGEREGAAFVFAGQASLGLRGGGFLYTNRATLSLGLVVSAEDLALRKIEVSDLQTKFRTHPTVQRLIRGGKIVEYSAHLVPELGMGMSPRLWADGVLVAGDAAGFLINNGYTFRGVDLAIASGIAAGDAAEFARDAGGMTASNLAAYDRFLRARNVLTDLERFRRAPLFLKNERLFDIYPRMLIEIAERLYTVDGSGKDRLMDILLEETSSADVSKWKMVLDLLRGARSM